MELSSSSWLCGLHDELAPLVQFIKGHDVHSSDARTIKLKRTQLVLVNTMLAHELIEGANHDERTRLEIENIFTRGIPIVVDHALHAMKLVHGYRNGSLDLSDRACHLFGWCPATCSIGIRLKQSSVVVLDLREAKGVDDSSGLQDSICSLASVEKVVALNKLLKLSLFKPGDIKVAQPVAKHPWILLKVGLPKWLISLDGFLLLAQFKKFWIAQELREHAKLLLAIAQSDDVILGNFGLERFKEHFLVVMKQGRSLSLGEHQPMQLGVCDVDCACVLELHLRNVVEKAQKPWDLAANK